MHFVENIDINDIKHNLKEEYKLYPDAEERISNVLANNIIYKGIEVSTTFVEYFNHPAGKTCRNYYFLCPKCGARCVKLYLICNLLACRKCSKIGNKLKINTHADRILKIQMNLNELFSKKISNKKKRQLIKNISSHYDNLDSKYKMVYNTFVFKELQKWCLEASNDTTNSVDYRKALKDVLKLLRNVRKILVTSGLSKAKNKNLKI